MSVDYSQPLKMPTPTAAVETLNANFGRLSLNDKRFAHDLLKAHEDGRASSKQMWWIDQLAWKFSRPTEPRVTENVGDMAGVLSLFAKARQHLRSPAVLLRMDNGGNGHSVLRLTVAGARAKVPGSINVTDCDAYDGDRRVWYGRVTTQGAWKAAYRTAPNTATAIARALKALAERPAEVAAEFGRLSGRCCFCGRRLEDERSTAVGYGRVCAGHYGLPWGDVRHDFREAASAASSPEFNDAIGF